MGVALTAELARRVGCEVLDASSPGFDEARRLWNAEADRRPAAIVRCRTAAHVREAIAVARSAGSGVSVRGGGHGVAGRALRDGAVALDLSGMRAVAVNAAARTARAEAGATWAVFDEATAAHGLATPGGMISTTGIAGLTLGGGFGYLSRQHGLACDNVLSFEAVTADGREVRASATENGDLFWALRGGGAFGLVAVTAFVFRLHPLREVTGGPTFFPSSDASRVLRAWRDATLAAPDSLGTTAILATAPPAPFLPAALHGKTILAVMACSTAPEADAMRELARLHAGVEPAASLVGRRPYPEHQRMLDPLAPPGRRHMWRSGFVRTLDDALLDALVATAESAPSPFTEVHLYRFGGAIGRTPASATAFTHRDAPFLAGLFTAWQDPPAAPANLAWATERWSTLARSLSGDSYVNFEAQGSLAAMAGAAAGRLGTLKKTWDPDGTFGPMPGA